MEKVYIGKIVNTHGIKGELRILSDFEFKDKAFKVNSEIYIDNEKHIIKSYRRHKNYDMITVSAPCCVKPLTSGMRQKEIQIGLKLKKRT